MSRSLHWWFPVARSWLCLCSPSAGPCSTCGVWPSARLDAWGFGMKKKTWRNEKKRMVLPCLGKKKAVVRYVFAFWLIKDVDVDIKHVKSNNENWVLYNTQGGCNRQTWSNVWIHACHSNGDIYIYRLINELVLSLMLSHLFHPEMIRRWLSNSCYGVKTATGKIHGRMLNSFDVFCFDHAWAIFWARSIYRHSIDIIDLNADPS